MAIPAFIPLSPRRPFPAKAWLDKQRELEAARAATPPDPTPPQPAGTPAIHLSPGASAEAGAPGRYTPPRQADTPAEMPLRFGETFDLLLLVSCLPERLHNWLIAQLQPLVAQYVLRQSGGVAATLRGSFLLPGDQQGRSGRLRRRLSAELAAGLAVVATPPGQLSRAARNRALVARAEAIGQVAEELGRRPGAAPLEQELYRALAGIRR